ncbi:hypothetical protein L7F22_032585 [Adiantum nelumboides]|nr:hypothetical protein [Adiantum nelumboides]
MEGYPFENPLSLHQSLEINYPFASGRSFFTLSLLGVGKMELHAALKDGLISIPQNLELGTLSASLSRPSSPNHYFEHSRPVVGRMRPNLVVNPEGPFSTSPIMQYLVMPQCPQGNALFHSYASYVAGSSAEFFPPLGTVHQNALLPIETSNPGTSSIYSANPLFFHIVERDKIEQMPKDDMLPPNDLQHTEVPSHHNANLDKGKEPYTGHQEHSPVVDPSPNNFFDADSPSNEKAEYIEKPKEAMDSSSPSSDSEGESIPPTQLQSNPQSVNVLFEEQLEVQHSGSVKE